jgi:hypothetical protein
MTTVSPLADHPMDEQLLALLLDEPPEVRIQLLTTNTGAVLYDPVEDVIVAVEAPLPHDDRMDADAAFDVQEAHLAAPTAAHEAMQIGEWATDFAEYTSDQFDRLEFTVFTNRQAR